MRKRECRSWTPVRRGKIYCSPACGGNCTYEAFLKATASAEKLARLCGPEFKPRVWENIGWHYAAGTKDNYVKVHPSSNAGGYVAFFDCPETDAGCGKWTIHSRDLATIFRNGLKHARSLAANQNALVASVERVIQLRKIHP